MSDKEGEGLPSNQELQEINQALTERIPKLEKQSKDLKGHLILIVQWWKEYEEEHKVWSGSLSLYMYMYCICAAGCTHV